MSVIDGYEKIFQGQNAFILWAIFITVEITHFVRIAIYPRPLSIKYQYNDYKENVSIFYISITILE